MYFFHVIKGVLIIRNMRQVLNICTGLLRVREDVIYYLQALKNVYIALAWSGTNILK